MGTMGLLRRRLIVASMHASCNSINYVAILQILTFLISSPVSCLECRRSREMLHLPPNVIVPFHAHFLVTGKMSVRSSSIGAVHAWILFSCLGPVYCAHVYEWRFCAHCENLSFFSFRVQTSFMLFGCSICYFASDSPGHSEPYQGIFHGVCVIPVPKHQSTHLLVAPNLRASLASEPN